MTFRSEINRIATVENRDEISNEVINKLKSFSLVNDISESTFIDSLELESSPREPIEGRFGLIIMNNEWEQIKTVKDIIDTVEIIMSKNGLIVPNRF
ncbi:MAG: hypothetical protein A3F91_09675 [Flavobacteria bacterium RIFCSPLOWO2_12_FULL_35_11]|nr:MAG: hypothetical protein A3F91_09675 [Flavobacteria bacterium RIFCSPLOWO2_12_FULL_35_11]